MENKTSQVGWKSSFYAENAAGSWYFSFRELHPRATKILRDFCGKTEKDVINLAQYSQPGWELFKKTVKSLEKIYNQHKYYIDNVKNKDQKDKVRITIQLLSSDVIVWVKKHQNQYITEANYLTNWYKKII